MLSVRIGGLGPTTLEARPTRSEGQKQTIAIVS
jgi:hypothetical protein